MDEPAYWRGHRVTVPTAGPNAKLVPHQPSWHAEWSDSCHALHPVSRHETVHEWHVKQWVKRAPKAMDEPAYWRGHHITVPTAGPNAKLVQQQPS